MSDAAAVPALTLSQRVFRIRKVFVLLSALVALGCLLVEHHAWYEKLEWRPLVVALGWLSVGLGVAIRLWATMHIGGNKSKKVVRAGPYAMTRNPLYFGSFVSVVGIALLSESIVAAAVAVIPMFIVYMLTIRHEERKLLNLFGPDYAAYCTEVPRFIPALSRLGKVLNEDVHEISYRDWKRELGTGTGFLFAAIVIAFVEEGIEYLHANGWPVWINF